MKLKELPVKIGVGALLMTVPVAIYLSTQAEPLNVETQAGKEKTSIFYLWPSEVAAPLNEEIEIGVTLSTQNESASEVSAKLLYDPDMLDLSAVENGVIFDKYTSKKTDITKGTIELSAQGDFSGTAAFATLTFKTKKTGKTQVDFVQAGTIIKNPNGADILQGVNGAVVITK